MGLYARYIFPRIMHWSMSLPDLAEERRIALAGVSGDVLEIGFGSGMNLPHYPSNVRKITAVDANAGTFRLAARQLEQSPIEVEHFVLSSERLPMADASFDSVVSTFTLCSIADVAAALREVRRVLRPGGRYFFLEHGLSPDVKIARWQHRFSPLTRWLGEGCHLDRPIRRLVEAAAFQTVQCDEHELPSMGKLGGYLYRGAATW
ncbi:MAG TPA: class I SAM-dependent methyltransferase [Pirellulales bacterium]|jgi:ubiquinone/menaquinone biosynthesis C-methylase UbiE|nr:class I SAM-dependent methyltransferase [Pirellulales bacterium]